uniref:Kinesin motor domain-containing protein n=1 Tax=Odontella aurita TaxID=265563 RepID=A0A7S4HZJ7_9STRA|mmetsp:Transcript_17706/g.51534  ORF Transcript_17706/g.51534 Transcript_17706/m.51534 type:complete len:999 (+) Transcript_17706:93-3089(+)
MEESSRGGDVPDDDSSFGDEGDTTMCVDEVEEALDNGGSEGESYNFAATLALRKNLSVQFDKHIGSKQDDAAPVQEVGGVKSKIANLEMKNRDNGSKVRFKNTKVGRAMLKPPRIPTSSSGPALESTGDSRLSVYLRIRPPIPGTDHTSEGANTVEILEAGNHPDGRPTIVRAYPPHDSNAAKAVRSKHHLHGHSTNTDLMFGSNGEEGRGVREYEFSEIFGPDSQQQEVYEGVAAPLVDGLFPLNSSGEASNGEDNKMVGQSALLFSYGITNAGKTYTIMGGEGGNTDWQESSLTDLHQNRGIMPRALHDILRRIKTAGNQEYQLNMSYFEIYNEQVYDLLVDADKDSKASDQTGPSHRRPSSHHSFGPVALKLREARDGKIVVKGLTQHRVSTVAEGLEYASIAKKKRHTSSNNINNDSSRSHCICQLELAVCRGSTESAQPAADDASVCSTVCSMDDDESSTKGRVQRAVALWIVDLAGSERSKRTGTLNKSVRQKEAALINSSLMKLTRCLQTLRNNQLQTSSNSMVPFRESKLTHLFMNHLTGSSASRTSMIVNINPSAADYDETQHVLAYATVARSVVISENDYNRKKQALLTASSSQHTHGKDGRRIKNGRAKSPPRKIARLASKLSPRSMLAKRREQQDAKVQKRKAELQSTRASAKAGNYAAGSLNKKLKSSKTGGYVGKQLQVKPLRATNKEVGQLRCDLAAAKEQVERLQSEALSLKVGAADRATVEAEIRMEISLEMEEQMQSMREQYTTMVDRLKMQIKSQPTPGKSTRKVQLDKAELYIEELMEKVDECEEEMERMRDLHRDEIANIRKAHEEALAAKSAEIASIKEMHEAELEKLNSSLEALQHENEKLYAIENDVSDDEIADSASEEESDQSSSADEELSPTPARVRRLRRERCSEVACSNVASPNKDIQSSQKKKKQRGIGILRKSKAVSSEKKAMDCRLPLTAIENAPHQPSIGLDVEANDKNNENRADLRRSRRLEGYN